MFIPGMADDAVSQRILIVRLGAMGDIIHALPAAAALRCRYPNAHLAWLVERKWLPLIEGNPNLDEVLVLERGSMRVAMQSAWKLHGRFDVAYDLQGLLKSAVPARLAAPMVHGSSITREGVAGWFYAQRVNLTATHIVDQHMELISAAGEPREFWLPPGQPEGALPVGNFVLASPSAGWPSKEWPRARWEELRRLLATRNILLVLNGRPGSGLDHESTIAGLIDATRRACWVVGVDSGPLHIAAALGKPGVAIFGPTDPARNGPYPNQEINATMQVLRAPTAITSYKRDNHISSSMEEITAQQVFEALQL
jgi:heptosyltransferase I